jgi:hypothetical protein
MEVVFLTLLLIISVTHQLVQGDRREPDGFEMVAMFVRTHTTVLQRQENCIKGSGHHLSDIIFHS